MIQADRSSPVYMELRGLIVGQWVSSRCFDPDVGEVYDAVSAVEAKVECGIG